ncbi:MAG: prephenate dehydrogenase [Actinobacteria bacterium]|nr:prephenate dehydrogenase [Actinomycetota bacterium]
MDEGKEAASNKVVVSIIGLGMIGGSLAAALSKYGADEFNIVGYNRTKASVGEALARGYIDRGASSPTEAVENADIVVVATPVGVIEEMVSEIAASLKQGAIVTDVGSTKAKIVQEVEVMLPPGTHFVGGHPMAGSEREGINAANPDIFKNAYYLLTPTPRTDMTAFRKLHAVVARTGANILAISPERHDEAVAFISHLPHLVSAALMNVAASETKQRENLLMLTAGGFRDTTRIAAGNTRLWVDICLENRKAIAHAIRHFQGELSRYLDAMESLDAKALTGYLEEARRARLSLPSILDKRMAELYELYVPVLDKPGVISEITLTVGAAGVNIEDIEILHATESSGTLRLTVAGWEAAEKSAAALKEKGYDVDVRGV